MLELTLEERKNWTKFKKQHPIVPKFPNREEEIIKHSKNRMPLKEIRKNVGGNNEQINTVRMTARRRGLY